MNETIMDVRTEALFVSAVQPSDRPTGAQVREQVAAAVRRYGAVGCAARMAQEYGDAPGPAATRMRWARSAVADAYGLAGALAA